MLCNWGRVYKCFRGWRWQVNRELLWKWVLTCHKISTVDSLVNSTSRWTKRKDFLKRFKLRIRSHDSFPEIWNFSWEKQLGKYYRKRNGNIVIISVCIFSAWLHDMNRRVLESKKPRTANMIRNINFNYVDINNCKWEPPKLGCVD